MHVMTSIFRFAACSWTARLRWRTPMPCRHSCCPDNYTVYSAVMGKIKSRFDSIAI